MSKGRLMLTCTVNSSHHLTPTVTQPVTVLISGPIQKLVAAVPETHLLVRKNIKGHHAPLAAPTRLMALLSVWHSHLRFLSVPACFYLTRIHAHTNGEGKQQLEQHLDFTPVKRLQLSLFILAVYEQVVLLRLLPFEDLRWNLPQSLSRLISPDAEALLMM